VLVCKTFSLSNEFFEFSEFKIMALSSFEQFLKVVKINYFLQQNIAVITICYVSKYGTCDGNEFRQTRK